jgi:hypothetical protein
MAESIGQELSPGVDKGTRSRDQNSIYILSWRCQPPEVEAKIDQKK